MKTIELTPEEISTVEDALVCMTDEWTSSDFTLHNTTLLIGIFDKLGVPHRTYLDEYRAYLTKPEKIIGESKMPQSTVTLEQIRSNISQVDESKLASELIPSTEFEKMGTSIKEKRELLLRKWDHNTDKGIH